MLLIARKNIIGITDDEGLKALDGYKEFTSDVDDKETLIELFENANPLFNADKYEFI